MNILNNIDAQKIILNIIISIFIALALWYVLILGNMVSNIVQRRNLEKEVSGSFKRSKQFGAFLFIYFQ